MGGKIAHIQAQVVVQTLQCQNFQDSRSKSTSQDSKYSLDKQRFQPFCLLWPWFLVLTSVAMVSTSMRTLFVICSQLEVGYIARLPGIYGNVNSS